MKKDDALLSKINEDFRPLERIVDVRFFLLPLAVLVAGLALNERYLVPGLILVVLGFALLAVLLIISLNRIHAHEVEYLNGLDQESLKVLIGKDMSYQSKFSSALVLQTLDRRFPRWRGDQTA